MRQVSPDTPYSASEPLFFSVSTRKLIVMSLVTFGLYESYWFYKQWKMIRNRTGEGISPFWRAVFPLFWCRSLFETIEASAVGHGVKFRLDPMAATVAWWGLSVCSRLPAPFWLLTFLSVAPLVLVQLTCNELNRAIAPESPANDRFSPLNVAAILLPVGLLLLPIARNFELDWPRAAGTFVPVDLSHHVNYLLTQPMLNVPGNDLSDLGIGRKTLRGVPFRIDGAVVVGPGETQGRLTRGPVTLSRRVEDIPVRQKVDRLYFLHAANFASLNPRLSPGQEIGAYVVHYADGNQIRIPLRAGIDIADWWDVRDEVSQAQVAWTGTNAAASASRDRLRLFLESWENPWPGVTIQSLDLVAAERTVPLGQAAPAPFLVAVTGELGPPR